MKHSTLKRYLLSPVLIFSLLICSVHVHAAKTQVAIVIDDIGWRKSDVEVLSLPKEVTFSVLPHTPFANVLAHEGRKQGRDILLHVPMEASNGKLMGPGGLDVDMNQAQIRESLRSSIADIPYAVGINNHMGSKFTESEQSMSWALEFLNENNLFFLDSLTSRRSQGQKIADGLNMPYLQRHIFLDNHLDDAYLEKQFQEIFKYAKTHRRIVAIAHPHPESVAALNRLIPSLSKQGIELVKITELLAQSSLWLAMQERKQGLQKADTSG